MAAMEKQPDRSSASESQTPVRRGKLTVELNEDTIERLRNLVFWNPTLTMTSLGEQALMRELARHERRNGGPFPPRTAPVKVGRRPGGR
jgi:hypothetical protein